MEAWPWLRRSASRCWITSRRCPIRASVARFCIHYLKILLLVLSATIAGADDFVETTLWGTEHLAFLTRLYGYVNGTPKRAGWNADYLETVVQTA
jgi:hypothetical protein